MYAPTAKEKEGMPLKESKEGCIGDLGWGWKGRNGKLI